MRQVLLSSVLLLFIGPAMAESAVQTDWSGGPGVYGPVTSWGDRFYISDAMDWDTEPGQLKLIVNRMEHQVAPSVSMPPFVSVMDMDDDGHDDIVYVSYDTGQVFWARNKNGSGTSWSHYWVGNLSEPQFVAPGDFNADGTRDIAASSAALNRVVWFRNNGGGGAWSMPITVADGFDARQLVCADFDGDGAMDIAGVSWESGDVVWWRNTNSGNQWTMNYVDGSLVGGFGLDAGDLNGDGHPDLAAVSMSTGRVAAYVSKSPWGYAWTMHEVGNMAGARTAVIADIDDDGGQDIVCGTAYAGGKIRWFRHESGTGWSGHDVDGSVPGLTFLDAEDMDGDGSPDILAACSGGNCVYWFKNFLKLGLPWERFFVTENLAGAYGVAAGDLSGDGVPDAAACGISAGRVSWWKVSGFDSPAILTSSILDVEPIDPFALSWDYLHWSQVTPPETGIQFRLRTSFDPGNMGTWSPWITTASGLGSLVAQGGSYVQYQARLFTGNPNITPSLKDVTLLYDMYGAGQRSEAAVDGRMLWIPEGNPCNGWFTAAWFLPVEGDYTVAVFDAAGRAVQVLRRGRSASGPGSAVVQGLPAGIYSVVLEGPGEMCAARITVLN